MELVSHLSMYVSMEMSTAISSSIFSCRKRRFDLGEKPPQANGVKVYKSPAAKDQVIIEADFIWAGEQDVQLNVKPIPRHLGPLEPVGQVFGNLISLRVRHLCLQSNLSDLQAID